MYSTVRWVCECLCALNSALSRSHTRPLEISGAIAFFLWTKLDSFAAFEEEQLSPISGFGCNGRETESPLLALLP